MPKTSRRSNRCSRNFAARTFADYEVGLLHGRMPNEEKQAIMQAFAAGRLQVLVSTTVIEVGIDVPNATVMTILGSTTIRTRSTASTARPRLAR